MVTLLVLGRLWLADTWLVTDLANRVAALLVTSIYAQRYQPQLISLSLFYEHTVFRLSRQFYCI
jgi:hypothetical protein